MFTSRSGIRRGLIAIGLTLASVAYGEQATMPEPVADPIERCFASVNITPLSLEPCNAALAAYLLPTQRAQAYSVIAMLQARSGNLAAARDAMDAALAEGAADAVTDAIVVGNLGNLLLLEGDYRGAIDAFNDSLALGPEASPAIYLNRSLALRAIGRYDEAAKDYALYLTLTDRAPAEAVNGASQAPTLERPAPASGRYSESST